MSIDTRVVPFSKSFRSLIKHAPHGKTIKDLKDLRALRLSAIDIKVLRTLETFFPRSAGALGCHTRIRAGFPRERWIARTISGPGGFSYTDL